jgi:hypothetical protein
MGLRARTEGEGSVIGLTFIMERVLLFIYMGGAWGTYGRQERYIRGFGEET